MNKANKITIVLIIIICSINNYTSAQMYGSNVKTPASIVSEKLFNLDFIFPGFSYERKLYNENTLRANINYMPLIGITGKNNSYSEVINFGIQLRHYYNYNNRTILGKNTSKNSMNYIAIKPSYNISIENASDPIYMLTPTWGLQRSYGNFHLNTELGFNWQIKNDIKNSTPINPYFNLSLGFIISQ